ncbi:hypothetical protein NQ318_003631 [Aromia moschata]|uniref:TMC domain-containing protein n=1 Tax=Aromia moschata TaxID=1265417 RepID=A0AAV8XQS2_9CUCU|nr:hypothetical protein NQ318_003631 [Aromia moschata]
MSEVLDHENASYIVENTFETFKTAIMSLLNNISRQYNETVDNELLNIYKDVNTTIAWFQETTVPVLPNVTTFSSYDVSSSTILLPFQPTLLTYSTTALGIFVRGMNRCWCWDLEKKFPQYGDFKVAENILHLVNNQGMVWMGMFFSPGLVVLNVIKLHIMMYFRAWAVLTCNVPHEVIFRASRSNNFYYALLLMMLFLCVLPVGYAIVWIKPSYHCGPFSNYQRIFHIFTETIRNTLPETFQKALDYIASPGIIIPLLVLLILIIYYLISLTGALREANEDLKVKTLVKVEQLQLFDFIKIDNYILDSVTQRETEERRKMFQIVDRRRGGSGESNELANTPFAKWKKILGTLPTGKSFDDTPRQESEDIPQAFKQEKVESKNKDFFSKLIKKALGKTSTSEDEEPNIEDGTDTELHESLPDDSVMSRQHKPVRPSLSWGNSDFSSAVNKIIKKNPSTSKASRQDSGSSVWSDNIPVITISKTESAENILDDDGTTVEEKTKSKARGSDFAKFKPKIKELERNLTENKIIKAVAEEDVATASTVLDYPHEQSNNKFDDQSQISSISGEEKLGTEDMLTDKSSSDDTEYKEVSVNTVLKSPHVNEEK